MVDLKPILDTLSVHIYTEWTCFGSQEETEESNAESHTGKKREKKMSSFFLSKAFEIERVIFITLLVLAYFLHLATL